MSILQNLGIPGDEKSRRKYTVKQIPIQGLIENPHNKEIYNERDLTELILDIQENGLRQALEVLEVIPNQEYRIIAGNSRYQALKKLMEDSPNFVTHVPCNVYKGLSPEEEMIMLITSNSTQRERSIKEILKEIKQIKTISENINNNVFEGVVPGTTLRMYLAEVLKIGDRQARRYSKIEEDLSEDWIDMLDKGAINVKVAYQLAQLPPKEQKNIMDSKKKETKDEDLKEYRQTTLITEAEVKEYKETINQLKEEEENYKKEIEALKKEEEEKIRLAVEEAEKRFNEEQEINKIDHKIKITEMVAIESKKIRVEYEDKMKKLTSEKANIQKKEKKDIQKIESLIIVRKAISDLEDHISKIEEIDQEIFKQSLTNIIKGL